MEVYDVLISLDPNKASGIDDIPPRILQLHMCRCPVQITPSLVHNFTNIWSHLHWMESSQDCFSLKAGYPMQGEMNPSL